MGNIILASKQGLLHHITVKVLSMVSSDMIILHRMGIFTITDFCNLSMSTLDAWLDNDIIQGDDHQELQFFLNVHDSTQANR